MVAQERTNKSNTIFLIVGKSGSGKDTLVNVLCEELGLNKVKSYTTRKSRGAEDENNHIFATEEDYRKARYKRNIVAETCFDKNYYWATTDQIQDSDFYIIDPFGVKKFMNTYSMLVPSHMKKDVVVVYITSNPWERIIRMFNRECDTDMSKWKLIKKVFKRFINDMDEFEGFEKKADYIIRNKHNHFEDALDQLAGIVALNS